MRPFKVIAVLVIVGWIATVAIIRWMEGTPESRLTDEYQNRMDQFAGKVRSAVGELPKPKAVEQDIKKRTLTNLIESLKGKPEVFDKDALAKVGSARVVIADADDIDGAPKKRITDPFAARLANWRPDADHSGCKWPYMTEELITWYDDLLSTRYVALVQIVLWNEPDMATTPGKPGVAEADVTLVDLKTGKPLAKFHVFTDHSRAGRVFAHGESLQTAAEKQFRRYFLSDVKSKLTEIIPGDKEQIGSKEYDSLADDKEKETKSEDK